MQEINRILEAHPEIKNSISKTNPLLSDLNGMSFGIEEDFPEE